MRTLWIASCMVLSATSFANGTFEYTDAQGKVFEGYVARPKTRDLKPRPLVLVVHDWNGLDQYEMGRCDQLAELGYVAVAVDVYGKGIRPKTPAECAKEAGKYYGDAKMWHARLRAGLDAALKRPDVDAKKVAAIGYCFGGTAVLEMMRAGMPVVGVAAFHGGLVGPSRADSDARIRTQVLALNGKDDMMVTAQNRDAFEKEMKDAGVVFRMVNYGGAVHAFTVPGSEKAGIPGVAYNEKADKASWRELLKFLRGVF